MNNDIQAFVFSFDGLVYLKKYDDGSVGPFIDKEDLAALAKMCSSTRWNEPLLDEAWQNPLPSVVDTICTFTTSDGLKCAVVPLQDYTRLVARMQLVEFTEVYLHDLEHSIASQTATVRGLYERIKPRPPPESEKLVFQHHTLGDRFVYPLANAEMLKQFIPAIKSVQNSTVRMYVGMKLEDAEMMAQKNQCTSCVEQNDRWESPGRTCVFIGNNVNFHVFDNIVVNCTRG